MKFAQTNRAIWDGLRLWEEKRKIANRTIVSQNFIK